MPPSSHPLLLVEDDPELRLMLTTVLELEGYPLVSASNGRDGLELARAHAPSLVVLDLMMPVMTGEEMRHEMAADPALRDIPVLVISAHPQAADIAQRMGARGCLGKPIPLDTLLETVHAICG